MLLLRCWHANNSPFLAQQKLNDSTVASCWEVKFSFLLNMFHVGNEILGQERYNAYQETAWEQNKCNNVRWNDMSRLKGTAQPRKKEDDV